MDCTEAQHWFNNTTELSKFKKHKQLVVDIINQTDWLPVSSSLPQRLWHIINSTTTIPSCKTCQVVPVSWDRRYKQYKIYCGNPACPNLDPVITHQKKLHSNYTAAVSKRQQTNISKYGHTNYLASDSGKQQTHTTKQEKYGDDYIHQEKETREATCLQKYGVKNVFELPSFQEIAKQRIQELYGNTNFNRSKLTSTTLALLEDTTWLQEQHHQSKRTLTEIANDLQIDTTTLSRVFEKHNLTISRFPTSTGEKQLSQFLTDNNITHTTNDRTVISPQELDIYIPQHHLAIEYCGLYWHSEQKGKTRHYHESKYQLCKDLGIQLLTIFEDEWIDRNEQVKRKILHLAYHNTTRVFARTTKVCTLTNEQKDQFFEINHIQGSGPGSLTYGLTHRTTLVAAMTFIKQQNGTYVLNRYATSTTVVGGFSKLVKHFQKCQNWNEIVSFADLRWSDGSLYVTSGWTLDKVIPPDYSYSHDGRHRSHKFNYRRKNLPHLLTTFDSTSSETQNCDANGILRIWDCGKLRFVLHNAHE
jgi:hypothetical protein